MGTDHGHNVAPRSARLRTGQTQQQLADSLTRILHNRVIEAAYIGRLERGQVRWPGVEVREAFRTYFDVKSDADLGFYPFKIAIPQESVWAVGENEGQEMEKGAVEREITNVLQHSANESADPPLSVQSSSHRRGST